MGRWLADPLFTDRGLVGLKLAPSFHTVIQVWLVCQPTLRGD